MTGQRTRRSSVLRTVVLVPLILADATMATVGSRPTGTEFQIRHSAAIPGKTFNLHHHKTRRMTQAKNQIATSPADNIPH
jgi:hypothetical protein